MRQWKRFAAGLVAVAAFAVPGAASADHGCNGEVTAVEDADGNGVIYVDDRGDGGIWVYAEFNGEPGLQSGGTHPASDVPVFDYGDSCNHENPDLLLY